GSKDWGDPTLRFPLLRETKKRWQHDSPARKLKVATWIWAREPLVPSPITIEAVSRLQIPRLVQNLRFELIVAITPGIERDGMLIVREDPGHSVSIVTDTLMDKTEILSYGPSDPTELFMREKTGGDTNHAISSKDRYTAFTWTISAAGFDSASQYIKVRKAYPYDYYNAGHQCTTETIEVAKRAGITLPPAKGKLYLAPTRILDSSTPAALLRGLRQKAEDD